MRVTKHPSSDFIRDNRLPLLVNAFLQPVFTNDPMH